ncbi:hypothetical protein ACQY0O_001642 [Thecaphora frezii]
MTFDLVYTRDAPRDYHPRGFVAIPSTAMPLAAYRRRRSRAGKFDTGYHMTVFHAWSIDDLTEGSGESSCQSTQELKPGPAPNGAIDEAVGEHESQAPEIFAASTQRKDKTRSRGRFEEPSEFAHDGSLESTLPVAVNKDSALSSVNCICGSTIVAGSLLVCVECSKTSHAICYGIRHPDSKRSEFRCYRHRARSGEGDNLLQSEVLQQLRLLALTRLSLFGIERDSGWPKSPAWMATRLGVDLETAERIRDVCTEEKLCAVKGKKRKASHEEDNVGCLRLDRKGPKAKQVMKRYFAPGEGREAEILANRDSTAA